MVRIFIDGFYHDGFLQVDLISRFDMVDVWWWISADGILVVEVWWVGGGILRGELCAYFSIWLFPNFNSHLGDK